MKLIMMRGLPSSGKSTRAREIIEESGGGWVRINGDLLRQMLHFDKFSPMNEKTTQDTMKLLARTYLSDNLNVIIDNTNLGPKHEARWKGIAKECGASFSLCDLSYVDMYACLNRNRERDNKVPDHVIINMALQYKLVDLGSVVVCDLDGTLCDTTWRQHFVRKPKGEKDWDSFFAGIFEDPIRQDIYDMVRRFTYDGYTIVFVSGRSEKYREVTLNWMANHGINCPILLMRAENDRREDTVVKLDIMNTFLVKEDIVAVLDDRPSVIRMWREQGLNVIDVGTGEEF